MRRLVLAVAALLAAVAFTAAAQAGCWATAGLTPLPTGVTSGATWTPDVKIRQHGVTPMPDAAPEVRITSSETGERRTFPARATNVVGVYRSEVVFPSSGDWAVAVYDGFPWKECAQVHTFGTFAIGQPAPPSSAPPDVQPSGQPAGAAPADDSGFPVWVLALALGVAAAAVAGTWLAIRLGRHASVPSA